MACATNKLVAKHVFRQFKCASPYDVCSAFGSIGSEIGKHGELKELETAIMGTYRQRVCDLNLQTEDVNPKTSAGKQLLSKFLRAQTMQDVAMALSATKDEKWMAIRTAVSTSLVSIADNVIAVIRVMSQIDQTNCTIFGTQPVLEPSELHTAIKWWLGIPVSGTHSCPYCPSHALDPHNHHALTCKYGGDVVNWHNRLRDILLESCHCACLSPKLEAGGGLGHEGYCTRPADILVPNWELGQPGALDLTITSPLNSIFCQKRV
ncbi:hypothetical protein EMCRGX_G024011 [Ephydatia muelleri]